MGMIVQKVHPHDVGLPAVAVRKRRRSRRLAAIMLAIALVTAGAGWTLFGTSIFNAIHVKEQPASLAIVAYALLIVSSATLVLGFWYMLLAQVERLARMVDAAELEEMREPEVDAPVQKKQGEVCPKCQGLVESGDCFCRRCGVALKAAA
jgi:hypothetical protein